MKNLITNKANLTITGANLAETLGISIFNIILLTYAKSFQHPTALVSIVSLGSIVPGMLAVIIGRFADYSLNKSRFLIGAKIVQAALYVLLGLIITRRTFILFLVVVLINIVSDCLGIYSSSLRLPILKEKIPDERRQQVLGLNQSVTTLLQPVGQSLGITIIAATHDYALAGYINALTFLVAAGILMIGHRTIDVRISAHPQKRRASDLRHQVITILQHSSGMNIISLLTSVIIVNGVAASIDALINLFILNHPHLTVLPFSVEILLVNVGFIAGSVIGSLAKSQFLDHLSYRTIMVTVTATILVLFINFIVGQNYWLLLAGMCFSTFCLGQLNPKLTAQIIATTDQTMIGTVTGALSSLVTIAVPLGSIGLVLLYNVVAPNAAYLTGICFLLIGIGALFVKQPQADDLAS